MFRKLTERKYDFAAADYTHAVATCAMCTQAAGSGEEEIGNFNDVTLNMCISKLYGTKILNNNKFKKPGRVF